MKKKKDKPEVCQFGKRLLDFSKGDIGFLDSWKSHLGECSICSCDLKETVSNEFSHFDK